MADKIRFGVLGSGWRTGCFLRTASLMEGKAEAVGLASRSAEKRASLAAEWNIQCFSSAAALVESVNVDFLLVSVPGSAALSVLADILPLGVPILCETPPGANLGELLAANEAADKAGIRVQVAEQYWLHPMHAARIAAIGSGLIGAPSYAQVSVNHGYHNMSLIRKFLGLGFENAEIRSSSFQSAIVGGPGRGGDPESERLVEKEHELALLDFGGRRALFDFEADQHRSWIRDSRVLVRGERGELAGETVAYLKDFLTPVRESLRRVETGGEDDFEGRYLKGVMLGDAWLFRNPTAPARLSDEEIAQARLLIGMKDFVERGREIYSLAEASQDAYLALSMKEAARTGKPVLTETQAWAK
jgi:predicted dehydrogenase